MSTTLRRRSAEEISRAEPAREQARRFDDPRMQDDAMNEEECFARFDDVKFWHSRTRALIAEAETYSYPAFEESFRELRQESRRAEFLLVFALLSIRTGNEGASP
jgi:hypothetical protein